MGRARDDAAGEAFDKGGRMMGRGSPGGPPLARLAAGGHADRVPLPFPFAGGGYDFSFSGLKTAALRVWRARPADEAFGRDFAASFRRAVAEGLVAKFFRAVDGHRPLPAPPGGAAGKQTGGTCPWSRTSPWPDPSPDRSALFPFPGTYLTCAGANVRPWTAGAGLRIMCTNLWARPITPLLQSQSLPA